MKSDPRLADIINRPGDKNPAACLVGFPSDNGVKINGGRPGASRAPELIRDQLLKLTPHADYAEQHISFLNGVADHGEISCSGTVEEDQEKLGVFIADSFQQKVLPVILGGGHETAFGHFLGYAKADQPLSIINIDAHTDVRPLKDGKAHSGSSFYQAVQHSSSVCASYNVFGLNPSSVSFDHLEFVKKHGQALFESETIVKNVLGVLNQLTENIMVTMDIDVVKQAEAPGVSAPNASGISSEVWLELAFQFGRHPLVTSFDLCEVNPEYDPDSRTIRLAALTVWYFLLGVALRDV
ncbi:MAG: formimidoylglutamase [Balneolaceae bacterium]